MYSGLCPHCRQSREFSLVSKDEVVDVRGVSVEVQAQYLVCKKCQGEFNDPTSTFDQTELAYREFRSQRGMLQPEELKAFRKEYGLKQRELCQLLGWGKVTLSRYESGWLQDESHDRALQLAMQPAGMLKLLDLAEKTGSLQPERIADLRHQVLHPRFDSSYVLSLPKGVDHIRLASNVGEYKTSGESDLLESSETVVYGN